MGVVVHVKSVRRLFANQIDRIAQLDSRTQRGSGVARVGIGVLLGL